VKNYIGVLGSSSLQSLFDKGFLCPDGGVYAVGNDTVDIGIKPDTAWLSDAPYASTGRGNPGTWGKPVDPTKVILQPGQTLLARSSVHLNLIDHYAFFSPRSRMARVGVEPTAHVAGFTEMNWAKGSGPISREVMVSITTRIPVKNLTEVPLFQMRVFSGDTRVKKQDLIEMLRSGHDLLIDPRNGSPLPREVQMRAISDEGSLITTLHLKEGQIVGFRLKRTKAVLDLSKEGQDWRKFFEPIYAKRDKEGFLYVDLKEGDYYLLITKEGLSLPKGYVASLEQLNARFISAVVHFAEYFGHMFKGAATLEVVPISRDIRVYEGSPVGAFRLEKVEPNTPEYMGFCRNQNHVPQHSPMLTMPKPGE
jgi:deoxycytidine triphosphate deaminase